MADVKVNQHSFAAVVSRLELNGYLSPFRDEDSDDDLPLPTQPVASYERTDSMSSTSQDSFYTLYDEFPSEAHGESTTPRTPLTEKGPGSPQKVEFASENEESDEYTILEPRACQSQPNGEPSSTQPGTLPTSRIRLDSSLQQRPEPIVDELVYVPPSDGFDDAITEEELLKLEEDINPQMKPKSKNLAKIFGQDPMDDHPMPQGMEKKRSKLDTTFVEEDSIWTPRTLNRDGPQESHIEDLRKKLAWRPTATSDKQKEVDRRDFAKLILGEDDALADKLFGDAPDNTRSRFPKLQKKPSQKSTSSSKKGKMIVQEESFDFTQSEAELERADKIFGALVRAHSSKIRKAPLHPPTIPPRASSATRRLKIGSIEPAESTPRTSDLTITDTSFIESLASPTSQTSAASPPCSPTRSHKSSATYSTASPSTVDSIDFRSFSGVFIPTGSNGQVKRLTAYHESQQSDSEVSSISNSSATASDISDSEIGSPGHAAPESPLSDAESDTDTATEVTSFKPTVSMSSLSESLISRQDLSSRPAHHSSSTPSLNHGFRFPLRSSSARSPSLDSAAPPPISLVRSETPPRTPRRRPLGLLFRKSSATSNSPPSSSRRNGRSPPPPVPKIDHVAAAAAAAAREAAERELLGRSVRYESAAPRATPFTTRQAASVFPRRKHRRERVHLGRDVMQEHELLEAMELARRWNAAHEAQAAERLATEVVHELVAGFPAAPPRSRARPQGYYGSGPHWATIKRHGSPSDPFSEHSPPATTTTTTARSGWSDEESRKSSKRLSALVEDEED